ncbi:MAG: hypothetical protein JWO05_2633 [Gemmatimonadetes bacterium]|nr:hypothetical protein [Gemmatimonadota bacterium]
MDSVASAAPFAAALEAEPLTQVEPDHGERLGIPSAFPHRAAAFISRERRLLVAAGRAPTGMRDAMRSVAARLAQRSPTLRWLVVLVDDSGELAIGTALLTGERPSVAMLALRRDGVTEGDAETVRALLTATGATDAAVHAAWHEVLGRDALTRRFYRVLEHQVGALACSSTMGREPERREVALLHVSRLLFLSFLQAKGWLDGSYHYLAERFDECMAGGGRYHRRVIMPLFFGTLNTPASQRAPAARALGRIPFLNGGLFAPTPVERSLRGLTFPDDAWGSLFGELLSRFRFTAHEQAADWSEAAVDPEMLGRAFESLMAPADRRSSGTFYTPQLLVSRVLEEALDSAIGNAPTRAEVAGLTILDPACGSGAFLVHALERVAHMLGTLGDDRPTWRIRRDVLSRQLFGVDRNATAVWLCELRLWLSTVVDHAASDGGAVPPLPNLDRQVRVGDALAGALMPSARGGGRALTALRLRYARASGHRKRTLARQLDREERAAAVARIDRAISSAVAVRRELVLAQRARDLFGERTTLDSAQRATLDSARARVRALRRERTSLVAGAALPFSFDIQFADVAAGGGFSMVIGNPPWVRLHQIPPTEREGLKQEFVSYRRAAWERGAVAARAGRGFSAQVDLSALFIERSLRLAQPGGTVALLVPSKLWRSLAGGGIRSLLQSESELQCVEDLSDAPGVFDAAVYPSLVVTRRNAADAGRATETRCVVQQGERRSCWSVPARAIPLDDSPGAPWILLPPAARDAFDLVAASGPPLAETMFGAPLLGVKCGCNEAFVVTVIATDGDLTVIEDDAGRRGEVERAMVRPLLQRANESPRSILWPYDDSGAVLRKLPPRAEAWLAPWRVRLRARADARSGSAPWWSLFRTEGASCRSPRVAWPDFGRTPRPEVLAAGDDRIALNNWYVLPAPTECDAVALRAWIASPLVDAFTRALAEPARGGWHRYLGWTMSLLPVPRDWPRARSVLVHARLDDPAQLLECSLDASGLALDAVAPLLEWGG